MIDVAVIPGVVPSPPVEVNDVCEKYVEVTFDRRPSEEALKKCSSETSDLALSLPRPVLGGGVTKIFFPRDEPLEMVTGEPPNSAPLDRVRAILNSSSRSVIEPLRLRESRRFGVITRGSPG